MARESRSSRSSRRSSPDIDLELQGERITLNLIQAVVTTTRIELEMTNAISM